MRAIPILLAVLAACSSVRERGECGASGECPPGSYCARTPDGDVCWPDAAAPSVEGASVTCAGGAAPCLRSGALDVEAIVADDAEVAGVEASLLGSTVPLSLVSATAGSGRWAAHLPLARFPFPAFEAEVVATVTARDAAGNATVAPAGAVTVTRLQFSRPLDTGVFSLTTPAVMEDGTVVTGATNGKVYFVAWDGDAATSVTVGTGQITAAPLVLGGSVWIGSEDRYVYEVTVSGPGEWQSDARTNDTEGAIRGSLALAGGRVVAASESGFVYAVDADGYMASPRGPSYSIGPVVDLDASIYTIGGSAVRRLTMDGPAPSIDPAFMVTLGSPVSVAAAAVEGLVALASNGAQGLLKRVAAVGGDPEHVATTADPSGGFAVAGDGSFLVPEKTGTVSRWTASGNVFAGWAASWLGGQPRTPMVLTDATAPFMVPTSAGGIRAVDEAGAVVWSGELGSAALQPGNIFTPPGQPQGEVTSVAYFAGADGVLHAVIVDGALDGDAPWPKAFHDPRNTNRAGPQP